MNVLALAVLIGCTPKTEPVDPADTDTDSDADTDADTDSDADTDADTDADADTDSDTDTDTDVTVDPNDVDGDGVASELDCDDTDANVFPGAPDICGDDRITNCDRTSDDGLVTIDGTTSFTDLGDALAAAVAGSEVRVCADTWIGPFVATAPVSLVAHSGPELTVLDGDRAGTTLSLPGDSTITGFTIANGRSSGNGGGIAQTSPGTFTVADCVIRNNEGNRGGGIAVANGTATVSGTTVEDNRATEGGGLFAAETTVDLTGSTVSGNDAVDVGGGVRLDGASLVGGTVSDNTVDQPSVYDVNHWGGGVYAEGDCAITGTDIGGNVASNGGGIGGKQGQLVLTDVSIHDHTAAYGGGIYFTRGSVELIGTTEIRANEVSGSGGGIFLDRDVELVGGLVTDNRSPDYGGGIYVGSDCGPITGVTIRGNASYQGGGLFNSDFGGNLVLVDLIVDSNRGQYGGGIDAGSNNATTITGGSIINNTASEGGGVSCLNECALAMTDTLIADNTATSTGGGIALLFDSQEPATLTGVSVLRNTAPVGAGLSHDTRELTCTDTDWGTGLDDNVTTDVTSGGIDYAWEANASFTCDGLGCVAGP